MSDYSFRFGPYTDATYYQYKPGSITAFMTIGGKRVMFMPWLLKHVDSITMSVQGSTSTLGIPSKPATMSQVFDTSGPVRTFKITGRRYDWEENVSNWDFLFTEANFAIDEQFPTIASQSNNQVCYIGLVWLFYPLQILQKGYNFSIVQPTSDDNRFPHKLGGYNVSITGLSATFSESEPGLLEYSITLTERIQTTERTYTPYKAD